MFPTLQGIVPPLVTPLLNHDQLDDDGLVRLVEHVLAGGVSGIFVLGTTGEGPSLEYRLRYELVERTCELVAGRVPVLVGITDTSIEESIELADFAEASGATAVVAAPPYYYPMQPCDVLRYFLSMADASPLPLFVYNMPSCTKVPVSLETAEQCASHANIVGIKDSCGDLAFFSRLLELRRLRPEWSLLIGPEHLLAEAVTAGGDGGVCGGANLQPRLFVDQYHAARRGDAETVRRLQEDVLRLGRIYALDNDFVATIRGLKCALGISGLCSNRMARPFHQYDEARQAQIAQLLDQRLITTFDGMPTS